MAIELKQTVKLSQQLLITPQLQQAIKLLQLSRAELIETVQKELLENPVLEESEQRSMAPDGGNTDAIEAKPANLATSPEPDSANQTESGAGADHFDWGNYVQSSQNFGREPRNFAANTEDQPNYENLVSNNASLHDHLEWQVKMGSLSDAEEEACLAIIGNLDDNGYLQASLEELAEKTPHSYDELDDALCVIQDLDPPGVGCRTLKECLLLQVKDLGPDRGLLEDIINNYLDLIEKRNFPQLGKKLGLTPKRAKDLADMLYTLEPKPGRAYGKGDAQYVTPDVYVQKVGEEYVVILNEDGLPKLQISNLYRNAIMKEMADKKAGSDGANGSNGANKLQNEAQNYIQEKLKSALWLIKSIHQRQKTL